MKTSYDPKADVLLIRLGAKQPVQAKALWPDAILHFDEAGKLVQIEVLHASAVLDARALSELRLAAA